ATGDFNADGGLDLAVVNGVTVGLMFNTSNGTTPPGFGVSRRPRIASQRPADNKASRSVRKPRHLPVRARPGNKHRVDMRPVERLRHMQVIVNIKTGMCEPMSFLPPGVCLQWKSSYAWVRAKKSQHRLFGVEKCRSSNIVSQCAPLLPLSGPET